MVAGWKTLDIQNNFGQLGRPLKILLNR